VIWLTQWGCHISKSASVAVCIDCVILTKIQHFSDPHCPKYRTRFVKIGEVGETLKGSTNSTMYHYCITEVRLRICIFRAEWYVRIRNYRKLHKEKLHGLCSLYNNVWWPKRGGRAGWSKWHLSEEREIHVVLAEVHTWIWHESVKSSTS